MRRISKLGIYDQHRCGPKQTTRLMDALHPKASKVRVMALESSIKASGQEKRFFSALLGFASRCAEEKAITSRRLSPYSMGDAKRSDSRWSWNEWA